MSRTILIVGASVFAITAQAFRRTKPNGYFCRSTASARTRDRDSGGTGLGLSIAARAVKAHGGSIRATNAEAGGLEVSIDIPLYKALRPLSVF